MTSTMPSLRILPALLLACAAIAGAPAPAGATPVVTEKTTTYGIDGTDGLSLVRSMDRLGPKQGFMSRAIAQTVYSLQYGADLKAVNGLCRVVKPKVALAITYIFPQPKEALSPALSRRWASFMSGVRQHEAHHGRLAREMARVAERAMLGVATRDDPNCTRMRAQLKRRVGAIYDAYDARQTAFDRVEHSEGGHVDRLISGLVR